MAKVEIEIDDLFAGVLSKTGYQLQKLNCTTGDLELLTESLEISAVSRVRFYCAVDLTRIPDDSIPFPEWVPEKWQWVARSKDGDVIGYIDDPELELDSESWCAGDHLFLTIDGFDTSWIPAMTNGDWTKAKWRRKNVSQAER